MEIITGYTGKPHVTSDQGRDVNIGIMGEGSYVLQTGMQLAAEVSSNNEIKIRDGVLMHQGCTASIKKNTYDSLAITNGSQGMKRVDLIVARYEKNRVNGIESIDLKVIQGTPAESNPAAPQCIEGDIQAGDYVADMPMYQVIIEGLNITEVKEMFKVIGSNKDLSNKLSEITSIDTTVKTYTDNGWTLSYRQIAAKMYYVEAYTNVRGSSGVTPGNLVMAGIPIELKKEATLPVIVRVGSVPVGYGYARLSPNRGLYLSATAYGNDHDYYAYGIVSTE